VRFRGKSGDAYADAAGYLCLYADEIREAVGDEVWKREIPVLRDAEPFSDEWARALRAVHDAATAADIPGGLGLGRTMGGGFPGDPPARSTGWVCPADRCSRVVVRNAADGHAPVSAPRCELSGQPMRLVE